MAKKRIASTGSGKITSGIEPDSLLLQTIAFVYGQLAGWRDDPDRPFEEAEDKLNLQLCKFLDAHARNEFPMIRFDHEEYQVGRRRVDMSASPVETVAVGRPGKHSNRSKHRWEKALRVTGQCTVAVRGMI